MTPEQEYKHNWYLKNRERLLAKGKITGKIWRDKNKERISAKNKKYNSENKEKVLGFQRSWLSRNREYARRRQREWERENRDKTSAYAKKWKQEHRDVYLEGKRRRGARYRLDPKFRLEMSFTIAIRRALGTNKAGRTWESLVGYGLNDLRSHLEAQFDSKMNWANYGTYWHIDHIRPKASFNYTKPEHREFQECWSLANLQPLEAKANIRKGARWEPETAPAKEQEAVMVVFKK